jgi:hypothetical protein
MRIACELRIGPEAIEALARRLAELIEPAPEPAAGRERLLSAEEVARWWGVSRRWVYEHASDLGVRRLGAGLRPRLRFDPDEVSARLGEPDSGEGDAQGSAPMRGDHRTHSLSPPSRAMVGRQARKRPGRRVNAPRPGADVGGAMERLLPQSPHVAPARPTAGRPGGDDGS